jgi:hypothetical protein
VQVLRHTVQEPFRVTLLTPNSSGKKRAESGLITLAKKAAKIASGASLAKGTVETTRRSGNA